jgi:hypothetical protein
MAESFTNALRRSIGSVNTSTSATIGISTNIITGVTTSGVSVGDIVYNAYINGGSRVTAIGSGQVTVDSTSSNTGIVTTQNVKFLGITTAYSATEKSILIGGTIANNTTGQVGAFIQVSSGSTSYNLLYNVPVPAGSSVVISDAGKTMLNAGDQIRVASDVANSLDVTLSILTGVS